MPNDVSYYQLISLCESSVKCQNILGALVLEGKLILIFEDDLKTIIEGKQIKVTGHKKRIQEIVVLADRKGFDIPEKSIKHYAKGKGGVEYVLVRR